MGPAEVLAQYGAIGITLLFAAGAVRILFQREVKAHDLDRQRADRMEEEIKRLNSLIVEKVIPVMSEATRSISDAMNFRRKNDR